MKKLLTILTVLVSLSFTQASNYKLNDQTVDELFNNAEEVVMSTDAMNNLVLNFDKTGLVDGDKTKGGFLIRAFFCGAFGIHRMYMGTGSKKGLHWMYCIPAVGGVVACVDFWSVVFKSDNFAKYKDNEKFVVWGGK